MDVNLNNEPEKLVRASIISSDDIQVCKRPNGEDWLLGMGSYGRVGPSPSFAHPYPPCLPVP